MKLVGVGVLIFAIASGLLVSALGGPTEAWAILRLDRLETIPLEPLGISTCYSPGFTHANFAAVAVGDSMEAVRARVGSPLKIETAWAGSPDVRWIYARQCTYIDSYRMRVVHFRAGRVDRLGAGVYYD